ncbi:MAG: starch synthase [Dehalococcoidia bacterium]|nr:starch synthase [Dehalococcoidia bacterium]
MNGATEQPLKVLFVVAEVAPFAKTGGLADVGAALPKALRGLGHDVRICMPKYGRIPDEQFGLQACLEQISVPLEQWTESVNVKSGFLGEGPAAVPMYFVDNERYFEREGIYGYPDDGERFILFCRAALEMLRDLEWFPDVIHCHDWHTAIVPNWLETIYRDDPLYAQIASVYTIHNLAYQGIFGHRILEIAGLEAHGFLYPQIVDLAEYVDLMGRGILFADVVTTVSETYAQEILTPEYGEKLDPVLRDRQDRLFGVLNGLDTELNNPRTDPHLAANFDVDHLTDRVANKLALQREAGLPENPDIPLAGMVSRLADQKGFDLLAQSIDALLRQDMQFVVLGTGDPHYHTLFTRIQQTYPDRAAVFLAFNTPLAQRIYAGSDMFLMPSRYEPCGLGQLIAMRYGSIPVVRSTGGLADTVRDWDPRQGTGNGFTSQRHDHLDFFAAVVRALETYRHPDSWHTLQRRAMADDYSWRRSASRYADVYRLARDAAAEPEIPSAAYTEALHA